MILALSLSHSEHGVDFPDEISHLVNYLLQVLVLQHQLVHKLVVFFERGAVRVASSLFQLAAHVGQVRPVLERHERLYVGQLHAAVAVAGSVLLRLVPAHVQPLEQLRDPLQNLVEPLLLFERRSVRCRVTHGRLKGPKVVENLLNAAYYLLNRLLADLANRGCVDLPALLLLSWLLLMLLLLLR